MRSEIKIARLTHVSTTDYMCDETTICEQQKNTLSNK